MNSKNNITLKSSVIQTIDFNHIESVEELKQFCQRVQSTNFLGFDTEFVSENRYRPELCLIQVATENETAIIDTIKIQNLDSFWRLFTEGNHTTIAHAAREEFLFCFRACGKRPKKLFDVQLAAGFVGMDYPVSYGNLVTQLLGDHVPKGETRTDWKRRPLTNRQIEYAIGDVFHLARLCEILKERLEQLGRLEWYFDEVDLWLDELERSETDSQWHRVSGASKLNRRSLAVLVELWEMRDRIAEQKNRSAKRILPDDLMIELAKRGSPSPSQFKSIRGFESRVSRDVANQIEDAIKAGIAVPDSKLPKRLEKNRNVNSGLVGSSCPQFSA